MPQTCVTEGGVMVGADGCCGGLIALMLDSNSTSCPLSVCADCGNGSCDVGETEENCPLDCGPCTEAGGSYAVGFGRCCDGLDA